MVRSRDSSSSSSSSDSDHHRQANNPASKYLRRFLPLNSRDDSQEDQSSSTNTAARAAGIAVLLGIAQQVVTRPLSQHFDNRSNAAPSQDSGRMNNHRETAPLLGRNGNAEHGGSRRDEDVDRASKARKAVWAVLTLIFVIALVFFLCFSHLLSDKIAPWIGTLPKEPHAAALVILKNAPVIDGHIDLPILVRQRYANNISAIDLNSPMPGHVDIPRLRKGHVGGFFWSAYVACARHEDEGRRFTHATWIVRDTLEQIDVVRELIAKYPETFQIATSSEEVRAAITGGKIASLIGIEGAHQLGNSIGVLRQYYALGVRYVTLTHICHNAFADSCGYEPGIIPLHHGLSSFGKSLIDEMNRLGVLVDLSHTSDETATQAIRYSKAPVIWSHSSARAVHDVPRNVPDAVLRLIGKGEGQNDAVVMVNFAPQFVADPGKATVKTVVDHIDHIAKVAGKEHVGLGSDFDGIGSTPTGLEDVSKYPSLVAEMIKRGWNQYEIAGLTGGNLLRIFQGAERVARHLQENGAHPVYDLYDKRPDLPADRIQIEL